MNRWLTILSFLVLMVVAAFSQTNDLQARIQRAQPGDTLVVATGVYAGNLVLEKRLVLLGLDKPVIRGEGKGSCVSILADSCVVSGFVIERSGNDLMAEDAGILVKSDRNRIAHNELRDILFGVYLLEADENEIIGNAIVGRKEIDYGSRGSGIHIWNSHRNVVRGNSIEHARDGFYIQYANHTLIERSKVTGTRYGLHYMYADSNAFRFNTFTENIAGAAIMYSKEITFRHNIFAHNRGFASYGILFQDCKGIIADSNIIVDNAVGLFFEASSGNRFAHNIIARNDVALQIFQNSTGNIFFENNFIDNLSPLSIVGKRTESHWSWQGRGNYWSSYDGYDVDGDGIGDVPMKIQNVFHYLEGRSPNLRLYLYSPASQALAAATRAFPIIKINEELDTAPLIRPADLSRLPAVTMSEGTPRANKVNLAWVGFGIGCGVIGIFLGRLVRRGGR
jgi:nitrous oxidase accessory protein